MAAELDHVVVLIGEDSDALQGGDQAPSIHFQAATETVRNQLAVIGISPLQSATGDHLISGQEHHLTTITEQTDRIFRSPAGHQTLHFPQRSGRQGDCECGVVSRLCVSRHLQSITHLQNSETMPVGCSGLQVAITETEMNSGEQLLGFVAAAGEQGSLQGLHQPSCFELQRHTALHHGQLGEVISGHAPHLIAAAQARELNLLATFIAGEGDR